ncbi:MAG TPA: terminase family protein [Candidatus Xenobia bacterium]|nr:terminase family protein [Candidatus Xenobia bacterium]
MRRSKKTSPPLRAPQLYPYQERWVQDDSRFKIACKARQIGFTFAAAWRVVDKRLNEPGLTLWISASERQALEAMEHVRRFCRELKCAALLEEEFVAGTQVKQRVVRLPNGSRIIALPANPDTVRGFAGDVVLDEFAFHRDAEAIWRAAFATATRGFQIEIISTPNGTRGKYYELARAAGLVERDGAGGGEGGWSGHWVDLARARAQGFRVDVEALRAAIADEDAWQQEYCCAFLSDAAYFIPPELIVAAESSSASTALGEGAASAASLFLGVDVGRKRDLTVLWAVAVENFEAPAEARVFVTRGVRVLERQPFAAQRAALDALLRVPGESHISNLKFEIARCAVDATGLGAMLAEELAARWGARVEPVVFTAALKEALAVRVKRLLEERRLKIPYDPAIRSAMGALKRLVTPAGTVRFDAERSEAGHADHFWALALAVHAAEAPVLSTEFLSSGAACAFAQTAAF